MHCYVGISGSLVAVAFQLGVMSYVNNMASAPVNFCHISPSLYEPRKIAVTAAAPDIIEKAEHQNEDTGK